jgi:hypothetical protein
MRTWTVKMVENGGCSQCGEKNWLQPKCNQNCESDKIKSS